jgi:hypothetical protein
MVELLLREHNHDAIGMYAFGEVPRIGETIMSARRTRVPTSR